MAATPRWRCSTISGEQTDGSAREWRVDVDRVPGAVDTAERAPAPVDPAGIEDACVEQGPEHHPASRVACREVLALGLESVVLALLMAQLQVSHPDERLEAVRRAAAITVLDAAVAPPAETRPQAPGDRARKMSDL